MLSGSLGQTYRSTFETSYTPEKARSNLRIYAIRPLHTSQALRTNGATGKCQLLDRKIAVPRHSLQRTRTRAQDSDNTEPPVEYSKQFGYSRKDVILVGVGVTVAGVLLYNGLIALGVPALRAGNYVQIIFVLGLCIAWVASYVFRVANKDMTYVKQLQTYEEQVMQKRLDEMPESEKERMLEEIVIERQRREQKQRDKQRPEK